MTAFVKIKALYKSLSLNEKKLADYTLSFSAEIRQLSSQGLADAVSVSQSSVVKFTQKLGYKGYPTFKLAIIDALSSEDAGTALHGEITLTDDVYALFEKLYLSKVSVLAETKNINDAESFNQALGLIGQAKRILISGIGGSALVCKDFSYKLQKLGKFCIADNDTHAQIANVANFTNKDLVFVISESGETHEVNEICLQAKKNNCKIISLTKYGDNPVSIHADVRLFSVAEQDSVRLSSILARTSQEYVIDMLFLALTQGSAEKRKLLEKANAAVASFKQSIKINK